MKEAEDDESSFVPPVVPATGGTGPSKLKK